MICFPNAKINLGLSVTEKRKDGLHNIETCFIPIPLYDILEVKKSEKFSLDLYGIPTLCPTYENLIYKAWNLLLSKVASIPPVSVCLFKNIPLGSGLGGGSSNAAYFLKLVNNLYDLNLSGTKLEIMASELGADCPFFIKNKPALASGTGNVFTVIDNPIKNEYITIVFPNINISTKEAYSKIIPNTGREILGLLNEPMPYWKHKLKNDFEEIAIPKFPELKKIKNLLYKSGAIYVSLTGSGSAIYAISSKPLITDTLSNDYRVLSNLFI